MIFLFPLIFGFVASIFFACFTDARPLWKASLLLIMVLSACFEFIPAMQVHFLVPLLLQVSVGICVALYWQL